MRDFDRLLPEIVALADRAGAVILEHYHGDVAVRAKADASPVTAADEAAEAVILARLAQLTPDSGGRGGDGRLGSCAGCRCRGVLAGRPARWHQGVRQPERRVHGQHRPDRGREPILGVVLAPARRQAWWGARQGASARGMPRATPARSPRARRRRAASWRSPAARTGTPRPRPSSTRPGSRVHLGRQLAQVLPGRRRQGRPLSALRAHDGVGHRGRARGARAAGGRVTTRDGAPFLYRKPGFEIRPSSRAAPEPTRLRRASAPCLGGLARR